MAFVQFNPTSGMKTLNAAIDYMDDMSERASDMRSFLRGAEPEINQQLKHEFDASNPNRWRKISASWREFKLHQGRPENIGIYTGALMDAATDGAYKIFMPTGIIWKIAPVESIDFTRKRKIGATTGEYIRGMGKRIVEVILGRARG